MKNLLIILFCLLFNGFSSKIYGQTSENTTNNFAVVSKGPINYRVNNTDGKKLHGYYKKGYNLTIYGDTNAIAYRADCDMDDDWSGANAGGTTQSSNSFESSFKCVFNPHTLYGTVLPGNKSGQKHYDELKNLGVGIGDLTITYKLNQKGKTIDSLIGVVFDRGPNNQPGESSVATCKKLAGNVDNNQYVYIIFPNSAKYIKQVIGTNAKTKALNRSPINSDFEKAYKLMIAEMDSSKKTSAKAALLNYLSQKPLLQNFDNATKLEKEQGRLQPGNNDRNINE